MRFADPYALRNKEPRESVVFAASQLQGDEPQQEDYFLNFNDECFIIADGLHSLPNGEVAAKLASETALWAFKHIRQHRAYWLDKKNFMRRIFRTTNMTIWQKQRERGFESGMATTLTVLVVGPKFYWLGSSGDAVAWLSSGGKINKLTRDEWSLHAEEKPMLGKKRLGLVPEYMTGPFSVGDTLVLATEGCGNYLTPQDLETGIRMVTSSIDTATSATITLLQSATQNGSEKNKTALIVKRIARQ